MNRITVEDVRKDREIKVFLETTERHMRIKGYTEHSFRHVTVVSKTAGRILRELGHDERDAELAEIAGYLHDIGNVVNRTDHAHTGAILAYNALIRMGMDYREACSIM